MSVPMDSVVTSNEVAFYGSFTTISVEFFHCPIKTGFDVCERNLLLRENLEHFFKS